MPSGASYPMIARELQRRSTPNTFSYNSVIDNRNYELQRRIRQDYGCLKGIVDVYPALIPRHHCTGSFQRMILCELHTTNQKR